jgi:hypothetical protein
VGNEDSCNAVMYVRKYVNLIWKHLHFQILTYAHMQLTGIFQDPSKWWTFYFTQQAASSFHVSTMAAFPLLPLAQTLITVPLPLSKFLSGLGLPTSGRIFHTQVSRLSTCFKLISLLSQTSTVKMQLLHSPTLITKLQITACFCWCLAWLRVGRYCGPSIQKSSLDYKAQTPILFIKLTKYLITISAFKSLMELQRQTTTQEGVLSSMRIFKK